MKKISWKIIVVMVIVLAIGLFLGKFIFGGGDGHDHQETSGSVEQKATDWTCSMHPQVKQPKPGKCPICFMDLIPLKEGPSSQKGETAIVLTPKDEKLAELEVAPVKKGFAETEIKMVGKVAFNESLIAYITARMPGRIDKLFVNYTGISVRKGDHMAEYYSPDLLVAQQELLLSVKSLNKKDKYLISGYGLSDEQIVKSVKKKLELWGLTEQNIQQIIEKGKVSDHITLYSPIPGIVIHKNALEGKYFKTGDRLFTIADLSKVWIKLDAYESDLMWLRYGQKVTFTTEAYPGEEFTGRISFIDPVLDKKTRTVKVRVDADNASGKLKPEMFVHAAIEAKIAQGGKVYDSSLAGKWISPMHPEIIKDEPGNCDVCGMELVKSESLGYEELDDSDKSVPLLIPSSAPLITGKRAVVYVKDQDEPGLYIGKEIILGPRAGDFYIVKSGLEEGDLVVTNGNFKLDSALQILAKPSMMSVKDKEEKAVTKREKLNVPENFKTQLDMIYNSYFTIQKALADDEYKKSVEGTKKLDQMLGHISSDSLDDNALLEWKKTERELKKIIQQMLDSKDINGLRANFSNLSGTVYQLAKSFGTSKKTHIVKFFCSMAFDNKGASWLQPTDEIANPYYGEMMLRCGEKVEDVKK